VSGAFYVEGNKDLILEPGTEMVIRTVGPKERLNFSLDY